MKPRRPNIERCQAPLNQPGPDDQVIKVIALGYLASPVISVLVYWTGSWLLFPTALLVYLINSKVPDILDSMW